MPRIPAHASTVYTSGDKIHLHLPAPKGYTSELTFPATTEGAEALLRLLRQREVYSYTHPVAIAQPSMPIQYVVDAWQRSTPDAATKLQRAKQRADAERFKHKSKEDQLAELDALLDLTF
jgi:hypothetical protein